MGEALPSGSSVLVCGSKFDLDAVDAVHAVDEEDEDEDEGYLGSVSMSCGMR